MKKIIEINTLENGSHRNQIGNFKTIPEGWAVIPDDMETPNFPFGDIEVKDEDIIGTEEVNGELVEKVVGTRKVVSKWTPGVIPEPEPIPNEPTAQDDIDGMLVDHEYRLTLLELGVTE